MDLRKFKKQFFAGHKDAAENPTLCAGTVRGTKGSKKWAATGTRARTAGNKVKGKRGGEVGKLYIVDELKFAKDIFLKSQFDDEFRALRVKK